LAALGEIVLSPEALTQAQSNASASYALTWIFGTIGVIAFASQRARRLSSALRFPMRLPTSC
jgi:hypothetical protein